VLIIKPGHPPKADTLVKNNNRITILLLEGEILSAMTVCPLLPSPSHVVAFTMIPLPIRRIIGPFRPEISHPRGSKTSMRSTDRYREDR
jgi:hypothetical protein